MAESLTPGLQAFEPGAFEPGAFEIVERENCFRGFYKVDRLHLRHQLFAGEMGPLISRELFVRHDAVCVLPYDPQRDEVVLIEQFRVGAIGKSRSPWLLELVAGLIDKDEQPEEVAHREAEEEAGLTFSALRPITGYFPSPGGSDEFVHLYLGRCVSAGVGGIHGLVEEGEDIRVHVWPLAQALEAVADGRIANAASIIALQWLALNRNDVRESWV
ncbi:MAG TPA: NUDIX domain-containing protein [Pseudomonas sp.]|nr:NUDIX domain-containing protein [Pseudomonas sp.]